MNNPCLSQSSDFGIRKFSVLFVYAFRPIHASVFQLSQTQDIHDHFIQAHAA